MTTRIQAESLQRVGFRVESSGAASGGSMIGFAGGSANETGTASTGAGGLASFGLTSGTYDVYLGYFDENDGVGRIEVSLGGSLISGIDLNASFARTAADRRTFVRRQIASALTVDATNVLSIFGRENLGESTRIDYIEFVPVSNPTPTPGTLAFSSATYSVNENGTPVSTVTVTRTGGSSGAVSATVTPTNGTATAGSDFTSTPIVVNFAEGQTSQTVTIPITNDTDVEGNETVNMTLSNPTGGATLGTQTTATLTIVDNDFTPNPGTLAFSNATYSANENGTPITTVTVTRTGGNSGAVSATVTPTNGTATAGSDFTSTPIVINFADGQTTQTVTIPLVNDTDVEGNETVNLTLSNPTGGATLGTQTTATLTIVDNDTPPATTRIEAESLTRTGSYRVEASSIASGGNLISFVGGATGETGTASRALSLASGTYDIVISYFDENDGTASLQVKLAGQTLDSWTLNQNLGNGGISTSNRVIRTIATNRVVNSGDLLEILGTEQSSEHARVDYIEFRPVSTPTSDTTPPTAQLTAPTLTTGGGANYTFTVTYSDNAAVDVSSLDGSDIRVTGPSGFDQPATFVGVTPSGNGSPRTATYQIMAGDGNWNFNENGTYTVSLQPNQVNDTSNNPALGRSLGTFQINVPSSEAPTLLRTIAVDSRGSVGTTETAEFSPDGQFIATGAGDGKIRLFRVSDGSLVWESVYWSGSLTNKQGEIEAVYFSPDGQTVAAAGNTAGIRLYRASDGTFLSTLSTSGADGIAFSPNGQYFGGPAGSDVRMYNPATWALRYSGRITHSGEVNSIDFSRDSQILVSGAADRTVRISNTSDGSLIRRVTASSATSVAGGSIKSVRLSADGTLFATANGAESVVKVFRVSDGATIRTLSHGDSYMEAVAFSPDGRYLATGGGDFQDDGPDASTGFRIYRTSDFSLVGQFVVHTQGVEYIDFSSDGQYMVTASEDGTVKLWQMPSNVVSGSSADALTGSVGVNTINNQPGNETLSGTSAADIFVFNTPADGVDQIANFKPNDKLQISAAGFGGSLVAGVALNTQLETGSFVSGSNPAALDSSGAVLYNTATGLLSFDVDGAGVFVATAIATLQGAPNLTVNQIIVGV
ncbi:MAG: Calx-beta domain-containing protein [Oculatellaceae cyanobacterium bins.114]|nr:Calx-beta domain-containing protein [Oculatellaceae cyanobacterium bins.114]